MSCNLYIGGVGNICVYSVAAYKKEFLQAGGGIVGSEWCEFLSADLKGMEMLFKYAFCIVKWDGFAWHWPAQCYANVWFII